MVQRGILKTKADPTIDTAASAIPEGRALDVTLVLLVKQAASVAG
jgi:hypothetical protein